MSALVQPTTQGETKTTVCVPSLDSASRTPHEHARSKPSLQIDTKHSPDGHFSIDEALHCTLHPLYLSSIAAHAVPTDYDCVPVSPNFVCPYTKGYVNQTNKKSAAQDIKEDEYTLGPDHAHPWRRPSPHDSRSPCPALNTAANHGYLPRDGRGLSMLDICLGIRACYNLSWFLAILMTVGSFIMLRFGSVGRGSLWPRIDLEELAAHGVIEHNASLTREDIDELDAPCGKNGVDTRSFLSTLSSSSSIVVSPIATPTDKRSLPLPLIFCSSFLSLFPLLSNISLIKYQSCHIPNVNRTPTSNPRPTICPYRLAPLHRSRPLIRALLADSVSGTHFTLSDLARARLRRTATSAPVPLHMDRFANAKFALSMAVLRSNVYGGEPKVQLEVLREWVEEEKLPAGWRPGGVIGFWKARANTTKLQRMVQKLKRYMQHKGQVRTVVSE